MAFVVRAIFLYGLNGYGRFPVLVQGQNEPKQYQARLRIRFGKSTMQNRHIIDPHREITPRAALGSAVASPITFDCFGLEFLGWLSSEVGSDV